MHVLKSNMTSASRVSQASGRRRSTRSGGARCAASRAGSAAWSATRI
jgi:hypothetical protein